LDHELVGEIWQAVEVRHLRESFAQAASRAVKEHATKTLRSDGQRDPLRTAADRSMQEKSKRTIADFPDSDGDAVASRWTRCSVGVAPTDSQRPAPLLCTGSHPFVGP
jgi:hypothetical protein